MTIERKHRFTHFRSHLPCFCPSILILNLALSSDCARASICHLFAKDLKGETKSKRSKEKAGRERERERERMRTFERVERTANDKNP